MSDKLCIVIIGQAGSGKTYTANKLYGGEIKHFATPIKAIVSLLGLDPEDKLSIITPRSNKSIRWLLQKLGDLGRSISTYFWVDYLLNDIINSKAKVFIIDDCRFETEIKALSNLFGKDNLLIKILEPRGMVLSKEELAHISEQEWQTINWEDYGVVCQDTGKINARIKECLG